MLRSLSAGLALLVMACAVAPTLGEEGYRRALFDGESLAGWKAITCQAGVEDGLLVIQEGDGLLRSHHRYRNFVLELSWRPRREAQYDSGVYFRCEEPTDGKPFPRRYQINLKQGDEGTLIGVPGAKAPGLAQPGQWNSLRLTVIGPRAELHINGQHAWTTEAIEPADGYVGLQVETPGGGQFEFRDIYLTELDHAPLFNGRDLAGWESGGAEPVESCWSVVDGLLTCSGKKGPWLRSVEPVGDFNLRLEYRLEPGGNSGVYVRVPPSGNHHGADAGLEVQILDDHADRYKDLKPYQYSASLYAIAPAEPRVSLPAGQWNTLEINAAGANYYVVHNGQRVIDADVERFPALAERLVKGHLGLQNHSSRVDFRHIRLGPPQP